MPKYEFTKPRTTLLTEGNLYILVCHQHQTAIEFDRKAMAMTARRDPAGWCGYCNTEESRRAAQERKAF